MKRRTVTADAVTLERRIDHLRGRVQDPRRRDKSKAFDKAEIRALERSVVLLHAVPQLKGLLERLIGRGGQEQLAREAGEVYNELRDI